MDYIDILEKLYKKYHILTDGLERRYVIDFDEEIDFSHLMIIKEVAFLFKDKGGHINHISLEKNNNKATFALLVMELQSILHKEKDELLSFKVDYLDHPVFKEKDENDDYQVDESIFVSSKYKDEIYFKLIKDILSFYGIKKRMMTIHKVGTLEPLELLEILEQYRKEDFAYYLEKEKQYSSKKIKTTIRLVECFDELMKREHQAYSSFFHLDNPYIAGLYRTLVFPDFKHLASWNDIELGQARSVLRVVEDYYRYVKKKHTSSHSSLLYKFEEEDY